MNILRVFDLTLWLKGFPMKEAKERLENGRAIKEANFLTFQNNLKSEIFNYHLRENSFYKRFIGDIKPTTWSDIPVLTKKELQIPLEKRLSNGFHKKNCYLGRTSGSSGKPLEYAKDMLCHALTWAHIMNRFGWYGINFNTSYQARFYGIPLDFRNNSKERIKDVFANRHRFSIFDLSDKKLQQFLEIFRKKKFDFINGHTSSIVLFAKFLKQKNIVLTQICPTLKSCIVTSEMLYDDDALLLEQQLGVPVINEYGASELDLIAFTNPKGEFQLNNETVFIEILDEDNKEVPAGVPGRIVVTSLFNKAHPFIRYDVGDIGVLHPNSTAKKPILQKLIGRSNDHAILSDGTKVPGHTFYYVTKTALGVDSRISEFILVQNTHETFTIKYVSEAILSEEEITSLRKAMRQYLKTEVTLKHQKVAALDRTRNGKLKQFVSLLPQSS